MHGNVWDAIIEYKYLSLAFIVISVLTVFVCIKAYKASKKHNEERDKIISQLKYENKTRVEFSNLTKELIISAEPKKLFDGVALNIQARLEKESDMNAAFEKLPQPQKYIYAMYYVSVDGAEKLSEFFKRNGKPLTTTAADAVALILGCKASELYNDEYAAFDEDNEDVSLLPDVIAEQDAKFAQIGNGIELYKPAADYIRQNAESFIA